MTVRWVKPRAYGSTKDIVARLIAAAGRAEDAAFHLSLGLSQTYAFADPQVDAQISLDRARKLAIATSSPALAQALAADIGGFFTPGAPSDESATVLLARAAEAAGRLVREYLLALDAEGGRALSPAASGRVLAAIDGALTSLAQLRAGISS